MNRIVNQVHLIGNLGQDPKLIKMEKSQKCEMSLATSEIHTNADGEKVTETQWHKLVTWGKQAEIAEKYLRKGSKIAVIGKLMHRSFEDKEGNTRYVTEVRMEDLLMLDKKAS